MILFCWILKCIQWRFSVAATWKIPAQGHQPTVSDSVTSYCWWPGLDQLPHFIGQFVCDRKQKWTAWLRPDGYASSQWIIWTPETNPISSTCRGPTSLPPLSRFRFSWSILTVECTEPRNCKSYIFLLSWIPQLYSIHYIGHCVKRK